MEPHVADLNELCIKNSFFNPEYHKKLHTLQCEVNERYSTEFQYLVKIGPIQGSNLN